MSILQADTTLTFAQTRREWVREIVTKKLTDDPMERREQADKVKMALQELVDNKLSGYAQMIINEIESKVSPSFIMQACPLELNLPFSQNK